MCCVFNNLGLLSNPSDYQACFNGLHYKNIMNSVNITNGNYNGKPTEYGLSIN